MKRTTDNPPRECVRLAGRRLCRPGRVAVLVLAIVWALGVANLTLFVASGTGPRNAVPLQTIGTYLSDGDAPLGVRIRNLAGNLAMLAPLGLALAAASRWRLARVALCLVAVSSSIEFWQLFGATGRSVDVDDVILNVLGGIAGWLAGLLVLRGLESATPTALEQGDRQARPVEVHASG